MEKKFEPEVVNLVINGQSAGNTGDSALDTHDDKNKHSYWCFTWNNYTLAEMAILVKVLEHECEWFVCQEEIGEQGTPHIQGTLKLKQRKRRSALKKLHHKISWSITRNVECSIQYCLKTKTRNGQQWKYNLKVREEIEVEEPYGWQLKVMDIIKDKPDKRSIHWFWEPDGNVGKSTLCKYLVVRHEAIMATGKTADINHLLSKASSIKIVIVDVPRSQQDYLNYGAIEQVKNGLVFSGKYDSTQLVFNCPHVIVFANAPPDTTKLSEDRWNIYDIRDLVEEMT